MSPLPCSSEIFVQIKIAPVAWVLNTSSVSTSTARDGQASTHAPKSQIPKPSGKRSQPKTFALPFPPPHGPSADDHSLPTFDAVEALQDTVSCARRRQLADVRMACARVLEGGAFQAAACGALLVVAERHAVLLAPAPNGPARPAAAAIVIVVLPQVGRAGLRAARVLLQELLRRVS